METKEVKDGKENLKEKTTLRKGAARGQSQPAAEKAAPEKASAPEKNSAPASAGAGDRNGGRNVFSRGPQSRWTPERLPSSAWRNLPNWL